MTSFVPIKGSHRIPLPNSRPAGPVNAREPATVTVRLRSAGDPDALAAHAYALANTNLAERQYLTPAELAATHGARPQDIEAIEHFAHAHNLTVLHSSAAERHVVLRGALGDVLAAFHADVQIYHHASGTYRGRRGEILAPEEIAGIVTGVFGLDTRPKHRSPFRRKFTAMSGPGGGNGVAASFFASRYNFPAEQGSTTLDGAGQTIAIIELGGGYRSSDLQTFFHEINSPMPKVAAISIDRANNAPSSANSADGEVMLDIEVAGAAAPHANIAVYFAPNDGDQGFLNAISAAIHDTQRKPGVVSISWGSPEASNDAQATQAYHELFAAAGALGITICVAAGDHGTADEDGSQWDGQIHVDHPASDDLVLACGGTQIEGFNATGAKCGEDVVWNDNTPFDANSQDGGGWAGGGGISTIFAVPSYQEDVNKTLSLATHKPGRGVPDIAMSATNYFTRVDSAEGASGGTSAVAPLMAALVARLNQALGKNAGFLNPPLYAHAAKGVCHDVTKGTNAIRNDAPGYVAGPGWDACSGLGTPDGEILLGALLQTHNPPSMKAKPRQEAAGAGV